MIHFLRPCCTQPPGNIDKVWLWGPDDWNWHHIWKKVLTELSPRQCYWTCMTELSCYFGNTCSPYDGKILTWCTVRLLWGCSVSWLTCCDNLHLVERCISSSESKYLLMIRAWLAVSFIMQYYCYSDKILWYVSYSLHQDGWGSYYNLFLFRWHSP